MTVELKAWCLTEVPGPHVTCLETTDITHLDKGSEPRKCYRVEKKIHSEVMEVKTRVVKIDMT